jgi:hypothetical protein
MDDVYYTILRTIALDVGADRRVYSTLLVDFLPFRISDRHLRRKLREMQRQGYLIPLGARGYTLAPDYRP